MVRGVPQHCYKHKTKQKCRHDELAAPKPQCDINICFLVMEPDDTISASKPGTHQKSKVANF